MRPDKIRNRAVAYILKRESFFEKIFRFGIALLGFLVLNSTYGYQGVLNSPWIAVVISVLCAFVPLDITGFIMFIFLALHLASLSVGLCAAFIAIWVVSLISGKACGSKAMIHLMYIPVLFTIHVPFISPMFQGFLGRKKDGAYILGGAVLAFFLRTVRFFEVSFKTAEVEIDTIGVLRDNVLSNPNFYMFVISVVTVFLTVSFIRNIGIRHSWLVAVGISLSVEFVLMLCGYIITGTPGQIPMLCLSNGITLAFGLAINFLFSNIKVNRRRLLEFEDDEFTYQVVAIPKMRIEEEKRRIIKLTGGIKQEEDSNEALDSPKEEEETIESNK